MRERRRLVRRNTGGAWKKKKSPKLRARVLFIGCHLRGRWLVTSSFVTVPSGSTYEISTYPGEREALLRCIYERAARENPCARFASPRSQPRLMPMADARVPYVGVPSAPCQRGDSYLKRCLFGNAPSIIVMELKVGYALPSIYKSKGSPLVLQSCLNPAAFTMAEEQLIASEDLDAIREGYGIPASIVLSASLCKRPPEIIVPAMMWFCERRGCSVNRYLWRELLIYRSLHGYAVLLTQDDMKALDNPPVLAPGWELRFFFAQLSQWEEPLPNSILEWYVRSSAHPRWTLMYFRGTALRWYPSREEFFHRCKSARLVTVEKGKKRVSKRVRPSEEGSILVDSDSSVEDTSVLSPTGGSPLVADHVDHRRAFLPQESVARSGLEGMVPSSDVAQLREELEVSRAEVAGLNHCSEGTTSDPRLRPSIFKEPHTVTGWSLSEPIIPKVASGVDLSVATE
ncbi:hypothetical protein ACLOJK_007200 [Asimina triloba]